MTSAWLGGFFTALGALIGADMTLSSGLISNRFQQRLATDARMREVAEVRRPAYGDYLTAVYSFMDRSRELIARIESDADSSELDHTHTAYLTAWDRLQDAYAPVIVTGPSGVEESAEALRSSLGFLADECDGLLAARLRDNRIGQTEGFTRAQSTAKEARARFSSAARDNVYG
jgi:hypothetical protein